MTNITECVACNVLKIRNWLEIVTCVGLGGGVGWGWGACISTNYKFVVRCPLRRSLFQAGAIRHVYKLFSVTKLGPLGIHGFSQWAVLVQEHQTCLRLALYL